LRKTKSLLAITAAALLLAACARDQEPAAKAVADAEAAFAAAREEAAKYVPGNLYGVEKMLKDLKDAMARGDYKSVIAKAQNTMTSIRLLEDATARRKAEMEAAAAAAVEAANTEWTRLETDVPKWLVAVQSRIDPVVKSKRLPKGVTQASFDAAKSGFETMKSTWTEAGAAFDSGNPVDAVAKARTVIEKGNELVNMLDQPAG
jgi:hypothetical protein